MDAEHPTPFTTFNFRVELALPGTSGGEDVLCAAAFSQCEGLEMNLEIKTIREGGNNNAQIHLHGPVSYGQLTLKRGMTRSFDLWRWFRRVTRPNEHRLRAHGTVIMLAADGSTEVARFVLVNCLPAKIKAPALNAGEGGIAIEEMQIAYERLEVAPVPPEQKQPAD